MPLETLALIFAILVLLKIVIVLINPKGWLNLSKSLFNDKPVTALIYFVLMAIVGHYVFTNLSIIQIAAVMLFTDSIGVGSLCTDNDRFKKKTNKAGSYIKKKLAYFLDIFINSDIGFKKHFLNRFINFPKLLIS